MGNDEESSIDIEKFKFVHTVIHEVAIVKEE